MEQTLLSTVGMLGFDVILVATLVLFALHAIDTWRSRHKDPDSSQATAAAIDCRLHAFPHVRRGGRDVQAEEPTRRAA